MQTPDLLQREFAERISIQAAQMMLLAEMSETDAMRAELHGMARDMARKARAFSDTDQILAD